MLKRKRYKDSPIITDHREKYDDWLDELPPRPTVRQAVLGTATGIVLVTILVLAAL
jgi:hypothetical protein